MGETIQYKRKEQVAVLTINRPERGNSLTAKVFEDLAGRVKELEEDRSLRVLVITGAGPKFFCAGLDLDALSDVDDQDAYWEITRLQKAFTSLEEFPRPVIAAINGFCIGGGLELALSCDIRLAAETARFSIPEVRMGLAPDLGGTQRLTRLIGSGQAKRMILSGISIDAVEAARIGLVEQVVPPDELLAESFSLARKIADNAPIAVKLAKRAVNLAMEVSLSAGLYFEQAAAMYCLKSQDKQEAVNSFLEKREPMFKEE